MAFDIETLKEMVTAFCQDDPLLNVIIQSKTRREFSDPLVRLAITLMVADFNQINITTGFTPKTFPPNTESVQVYGTIYHLLNSASLLQVRNHLPYNDTGLSIGQFAKSGEYAGLANSFKAQFEARALQVKHDYNMSQGYGCVPSQYAWYGGYATIYGH